MTPEKRRAATLAHEIRTGALPVLMPPIRGTTYRCAMPETSVDEPTSGGGLAVHASRFLGAVFVSFLLIAACWLVEIVNYTDNGGLIAEYGIRAHDVGAFWHIFTAPFLHSGLDHLLANTVPLAVLGFLAALRGVGRFAVVSLIIAIASGLGVWFLSNPGTVTVGASGLIFGY